MQPILMLAILGVGATAVGAGFLSNVITLNVQQLGVGQADLTSPLDTANIDLEVHPVQVQGQDFFKNVVDVCSFHSADEIPQAGPDMTVICKLTGADGNVIAEGSTLITYQPSETFKIQITEFAFLGSNQVQNVHDVTIVALGHNPTP